MKLRVQYTAQLRTAVGRAEEDVELPEGSTLSELLAHLATRGRDVAVHLVTDVGAAQPSLLMAVNSAAVPAHAAAATPIKCGDVVTLMPPIAGG